MPRRGIKKMLYQYGVYVRTEIHFSRRQENVYLFYAIERDIGGDT